MRMRKVIFKEGVLSGGFRMHNRFWATVMVTHAFLDQWIGMRRRFS